MPEQPAFEIITQDRHIKIYASGRVEGIGTVGRVTIVNRIPEVVARACEVVREQFSQTFEDDLGADR